MEWNRLDWNGIDWNEMEWKGMEWNEMEWNEIEWNGQEWNRIEQKRIEERLHEFSSDQYKVHRQNGCWYGRMSCILLGARFYDSVQLLGEGGGQGGRREAC